MQEGTLALMQLVRTCGAIAQLQDAGVPYISLLTDPTTGGVFASYAALGDVNLAEPGARRRDLVPVELEAREDLGRDGRGIRCRRCGR